jgi:Protein of unknown function (DUF3866)
VTSLGGMIRWRSGVVVSLGRSWPGACELTVLLDDDVQAPALAYDQVVGRPQVGDRVLLNVTALALGLGTGGYAMVVALPDRLPVDPQPAPGHLVKSRYTPLQTTVLGVDEQESASHDVLRDADDLTGMPVVVADLHSALPAIIAGIRNGSPAARVAYVMTDGGALPLWYSRSVAQLRAAGWLTCVVTVGQAYGGDAEAVTLHTGLLAARHVYDADVAVVAQGPGNLGSGTRWGFSGVACGEAVNAVSVLNGRCVASLRISQADRRDRHYGISHHSLTAYGRAALAPADVVVPVLTGELSARVADQLRQLARHRIVTVTVDGLLDVLRASPVPLRTMGRGLEEDPAYFVAAAAAGRHAAELLGEVRRSR